MRPRRIQRCGALVAAGCLLAVLTGCQTTRQDGGREGRLPGRLNLDRLQAARPIFRPDWDPLALAAQEHLWFSREAVHGGRGIGGGGCGCN